MDSLREYEDSVKALREAYSTTVVTLESELKTVQAAIMKAVSSKKNHVLVC